MFYYLCFFACTHSWCCKSTGKSFIYIFSAYEKCMTQHNIFYGTCATCKHLLPPKIASLKKIIWGEIYIKQGMKTKKQWVVFSKNWKSGQNFGWNSVAYAKYESYKFFAYRELNQFYAWKLINRPKNGLNTGCTRNTNKSGLTSRSRNTSRARTLLSSVVFWV